MSPTSMNRGYVSLAPLRTPAFDDAVALRRCTVSRPASLVRDVDMLLSVTISCLREDGNAIADNLAKRLAFLAPLHRLPADILADILDMVADTCGGAQEGGQRVGAPRSVSASWVDVVDGSPQLWTATFAIPCVSSLFPLSVNVCLSRSLSPTVVHTLSGADNIAMSAINELLVSGERWLTAVIWASWSCFANNTFLQQYPVLTTATLYLQGDADAGALRWLRSAYALRSLTLVCATSRMSGSFTLQVPMWPRLTSLTVCGLRDGTVRFLASLVLHCSWVEYLHVDSLLDAVADDIDINDVGVISMRNLRTLRLDNHTSFMLVIICAPHLQQLTLNDFDEYRPGILDLEAMLNRPGAQPMLEELTIARVDSCLPHTSGALLQCLRKLEWLKKLDIDDFSTEMQSLGSAFLFDSLTFRYGAPVLMPALSIFDYRPTPSGMSGETADALQKFMASRRRRRVAGDIVAEAVVVRVSDI